LALTLKPADYKCPDHHVDLTDQVVSLLQGEDIPVAGYDSFYYQIGKSSETDRAFTVVARCPGKKATEAHDVECSGLYSTK
jgi:hypothetical protein